MNSKSPSRRLIPVSPSSRALAPRALYQEVAERLRAGVIWANTYNKFDPTSPFGGVRESGFGREGGRHGLEGYLDV